MAENKFLKEKIGGPEADIMGLKERVEKLEGIIDKEKTLESEKIVKKEIKDYIEETQNVPSFSAPVSTRDEAGEIAKFQPGQQVGALVSLVFEKGLSEAVKVAKNLENPAVLDEFHDVLVDRYYEEMIKRGIIK